MSDKIPEGIKMTAEQKFLKTQNIANSIAEVLHGHQEVECVQALCLILGGLVAEAEKNTRVDRQEILDTVMYTIDGYSKESEQEVH